MRSTTLFILLYQKQEVTPKHYTVGIFELERETTLSKNISSK